MEFLSGGRAGEVGNKDLSGSKGPDNITSALMGRALWGYVEGREEEEEEEEDGGGEKNSSGEYHMMNDNDSTHKKCQVYLQIAHYIIRAAHNTHTRTRRSSAVSSGRAIMAFERNNRVRWA